MNQLQSRRVRWKLWRAAAVAGVLGFLAVPLPAQNVPWPDIPADIFNVADYGAVGNGVNTNTAAIQSAINAAAANVSGGRRGGTVEIPAAAGSYLCGPITLANNVNLQIDAGATLQMLPYGSYPGGTSPTDFIGASGLTNIEISGFGIIDGQGAAWWAAYSASGISRPKAMFAPSSCKLVLIRDITLKNPPNTHISFRNACGNATVTNITIATAGTGTPNTDGIDLNATNCVVENCSISCGDDNIALGSAANHDVLVRNCAFGVGHGMSIGSFTTGGLNRMTVSNCTFNGTTSGIRMKSTRGRGGLVQNLIYCNIAMTNVQYPIFISSYYPDNTIPSDPSTDPAQAVNSSTPIWRNITISNLTVVSSSGNAGRIYGLPEMTVSNVVLARVTVSAATTFQSYNVQGLQLLDSNIKLSGNNNSFTLFNTGLNITNALTDTNLITLDVPTVNPASNTLSLFGARVSLKRTNVLSDNPTMTLGSAILTVSNNLNLGSSSVLNLNLGTNDTVITVVSNLAADGTINISPGSGFTNATYLLFRYGANLTWAPPVLGTIPPGFAGSWDTNTPGQVKLVVSVPGPGTPSNLTAFGTNLSVRLNWSPATGAEGYNLKRSMTNGGPYATIANVPGTNYSDAPVNPGTACYYVVAATNSAGQSADSLQASAVPLPSAVATNLNFQANGNQLQLVWPPDHLGWRLQFQTNALTSGLGTNWMDWPGSTQISHTNIVLGPANGSVFFRLAYP